MSCCPHFQALLGHWRAQASAGDPRLPVMRTMRKWLAGKKEEVGRPHARTIAAVLMGVLTEEDGCPALLSEALCALRYLSGVGGDSPLRAVVAAAESADSALVELAVHALAVMVLRRSRIGIRPRDDEVTASELLRVAVQVIERARDFEHGVARWQRMLSACVALIAETVSFHGARPDDREAAVDALARLADCRREPRVVCNALDAVRIVAGPDDPRVLSLAKAVGAAVLRRYYDGCDSEHCVCNRRSADRDNVLHNHVAAFVSTLSTAAQTDFVAALFKQLSRSCRRTDAVMADCACLSGALGAALKERLIGWLVRRAQWGRRITALPALLRRASSQELMLAGDQGAHFALRRSAEVWPADDHAAALDRMAAVGPAAYVRSARALLQFGGVTLRNPWAALADVGLGMESTVEFIGVWDADWATWQRRCRTVSSDFPELSVHVRWGDRQVQIELPGDSIVLDLACRAAEYFQREYGYEVRSSKGHNLYKSEIREHFGHFTVCRMPLFKAREPVAIRPGSIMRSNIRSVVHHAAKTIAGEA